MGIYADMREYTPLISLIISIPPYWMDCKPADVTFFYLT